MSRSLILAAPAGASSAASPARGLRPPLQHGMLHRLEIASGRNFDREYLNQQVQAHEMALHRNCAANGDTPALRQVASTAVPIVQAHYDRVRSMANGL